MNFLKRIHAGLESLAIRNKKYVEKVLGRLPNSDEVDAVDFATDADLAIRYCPLSITRRTELVIGHVVQQLLG